MRYRVKTNTMTNFTPNTYSGQQRLDSCSTSTVWASLPFNYQVGEFEAMSDVVVPNFKARVAKGEVFVNQMTKTKYDRSLDLSGMSYHVVRTAAGSKPCQYRQDWGTSPHCLSFHVAPVNHIGPKFNYGNLRTLAGTQAAANVDDPTFEGAVFLAELRETIQFLRNPISSWQKFLKTARKKHAKSGQKNKELFYFIADNWLTYRYAVRPIVSDCQNAIKAIEEVVSGHRPKRQTARGYAADYSTDSYTNDIVKSNGSTVRYTHETKRDINVRAGVLYEYSRSPDTFGVRLQDVPSAAWEVVPWSFVVDWFVNIGSYISAITPRMGVKELGSWTVTTERANTIRTSWWAAGGNDTYGYRVVENNNLTLEYYNSLTKTRAPGINVGLAYNPITITGDLGVARLIDSLALSSQLLRKKFR